MYNLATIISFFLCGNACHMTAVNSEAAGLKDIASEAAFAAAVATAGLTVVDFWAPWYHTLHTPPIYIYTSSSAT